MAKVARTAIIRGAAGGFITGVGGLWAMPLALPVNVVEFYVQAARMVSAIATLRGQMSTTLTCARPCSRPLFEHRPSRSWSRPFQQPAEAH